MGRNGELWGGEVAERFIPIRQGGGVRRSGRGTSRPEGVDAVHRSWNSAAEPFYKLAKGALVKKLKPSYCYNLTPGCH